MGKGAYRGPWMFETTAREMAIDYAAREIGLDPVELRRKNLLARRRPAVHRAGRQVFTEITPLETLDQALEMLDYEAFRKEQAAARAEGRYLGLGLSVYVEPTSMGGATLHTEGATVRVESQRTSRGVPRHHVARPERRDHDGAGRRRHPRRRLRRRHRRAGRHAVHAVRPGHRRQPHRGHRRRRRTRRDRCAVRDKVLQVAAHAHGGVARRPRDRRRHGVGAGHAEQVDDSSRDVAQIAYANSDALPPDLGAGLEATVRFRPDRFPTWSNATHALRRRDRPRHLDAGGEALHRVARTAASMINPNVVEGQISGGVVQGIAGVLLEDFVYDSDGTRSPARSWTTCCRPPRRSPTSRSATSISESTTNPGGFKGWARAARSAPRRGGQRGGGRARPPRRTRHEDAARPRRHLRVGRSGARRRAHGVGKPDHERVASVGCSRCRSD